MITILPDPNPDLFDFSWKRCNLENPITKNKIPGNLLVHDIRNMIMKQEDFNRYFYKRLHTILKDFS
jgi:hypothetical protein